MNKQQMLDLTDPTIKETVIQQLLIGGSKTSLEADRRVISKINKTLYKSTMKSIPLNELEEALEIAAILAGGGAYDTRTPNINAKTEKPTGNTKTA